MSAATALAATAVAAIPNTINATPISDADLVIKLPQL
jgi:hypothetical protein